MRDPLSTLFGFVVGTRNALYDRGTLEAKRLSGSVISVGNISVGGTGKTPFVILLGELLKARGVRFDVLSRGYRRKSKGVVMVSPDGSPAEYGDEPLLIARRLRVPVIVGESRYEAGLFAEQKFGSRLHLLDDGFQHRSLARDYDIVLLSPRDLQDALLPIGRLREPLTSLQRADAIVLTSGAEPNAISMPNKLRITVERGICVTDIPTRPLAFCAIGQPMNFFRQLREAGVEIVAEMKFRDHHAYRSNDIAELLKAAKKYSANGFVTTEKDAVNLGKLGEQLKPLRAVPVTMKMHEADAVLDTILGAIEKRRAERA